jgi:hypothetical protein
MRESARGVRGQGEFRPLQALPDAMRRGADGKCLVRRTPVQRRRARNPRNRNEPRLERDACRGAGALHAVEDAQEIGAGGEDHVANARDPQRPCLAGIRPADRT